MCPAGRSAWLEQWNWKSPATCLTVCSSTKEKQKKQTVSSTKWHKRKENPSPARLDVAAPQNRHLKMRLIQPLPLRAARRKNSRKTIMHRCNQGRFKEKKKKTKLNKKKKCYLFYTFSVCSYWKNNPRRLWFVFLQTFLLSWPQIWLLLFLF